MSYKDISDLLELNDELRKKVLHKIHLSEQDLQKEVNRIVLWFQDQRFIGKGRVDPKQVENMLILHKGCYEGAKHALINYYMLKSALPEYFMNRDPHLPEIRETLKAINFSFQSPVSKSGERYLCFQLKEDADKLDLDSLYKLLFIEMDMKIRSDYVRDLVVINDLRNFKKEHLDKLDTEAMRKCTFAFQEAFGQNFKSMHVLRGGDVDDEVIDRLKNVHRKNTLIMEHRDVDSLVRSLDPRVLPKNMGGEQKNVDEVQDKWLKKVDQWRDWLLQEDKLYQE